MTAHAGEREMRPRSQREAACTLGRPFACPSNVQLHVKRRPMKRPRSEAALRGFALRPPRREDAETVVVYSFSSFIVLWHHTCPHRSLST